MITLKINNYTREQKRQLYELLSQAVADAIEKECDPVVYKDVKNAANWIVENIDK